MIIVIVVIVVIILITVINNDMMIWDNDIGDNQSDMFFWVCLKIYIPPSCSHIKIIFGT